MALVQRPNLERHYFKAMRETSFIKYMRLLSPGSDGFDFGFVLREYFVYRKCGNACALKHVCACTHVSCASIIQ